MGALLSLAVLCSGCHHDDSTNPPPAKTTPSIAWAAPSPITYGTALSSTQLNATTPVDGSFAYSPPASTVLGAGTQTLSVTFTPTDSTRYNSASASVSLTVNKATPTVSWPAPAPIASGTPLSAAQLDATASVSGAFVYTPPAATVLSAGAQTLTVSFTPTDSANYTTASGTVSLTVNAAASGIGPAGGTVNGFYGASVTVPAGALSGNVDIQIARDDAGAPAMPSSGVDAAGAIYALTPHGTAFSLPPTVQIPFDSTRIPTDATPVIYKAEPGGAFTPIPTTVNGTMLSAEVSNFSWVIPGFASTLPRMVYAMTRDSSGVSVSSFKIDKATGALSAPTSAAPVGTGAISITVHPSRRFLYVTNGSGSAQGTASAVPANSISVYQLDPVTGAVTGPTDTKPINGNPISVVVHPTGKFVYVVNEVRFGTPVGNLSAFSIDSATGALTSMGTTADSGGAPATALAFVPSGEFAYVTYLHAVATPGGNTLWDSVATYSVNPISGLLSGPIGTAATGDNPWAMVVTPGGHYAYVASLGTQGSVNQLSSYSINQASGILTLRNSVQISTGSGQSPGALALDPLDRFVYVGTQGPVFVPPSSNFNVQVFNIDPNNGGLSFASGVATASNPQGPISVIAEPQGQFAYVLDGNGELESFKVGSNGALTASGSAVDGIFLGGATGGVGDPFFFAAGGTSPVWIDNCTLIAEGGPYVYLDACPTIFFSSGPGSNSGSNGGSASIPQQPPATSFTLQVLVDLQYGGSVTSAPAGIDVNPVTGQNFFNHGFPNGTMVELTAAPPDSSQSYDVKWTGDCSGDTVRAFVTLSQDQHCYVAFTPISSR
jgi:6-phosphogluconolactonase (cycloisomerase 2 family)